MKLDDVLKVINLNVDKAAEIAITGLSLDSRTIEYGFAFVAIQGSDRHGMEYVDQAISQGAVVVLYDHWDGPLPSGIPSIAVPKLRERLGTLAHAFFSHPADRMQVIGVTGTNGKTTTVHLIGQLANALGLKVGRMGTLGIFVGSDQVVDGERTTPDAVSVAEHFATFRDRGVALCAMEVSSHALDQHRVAGVPFEVGVFTNLTRDHLDYHGTMAAYGAAKRRLFIDYSLRAAVIDIDDAFGAQLAIDLPDLEQWTIGSGPDARVRILGIEATDHGSLVAFSVNQQTYRCHIPLLGHFNAKNTLAALTALHACGRLDWAATESIVGELRAAPGRMEAFQAEGAPTVVVDYAHTPDALKHALETARWHTRGALWVVFGCGGDRDRGKRPLMGEVASACADRIVLTSDNPRSERLETIIADIQSGLPLSVQIDIEPDRAQAIQKSFDAAGADDLILVAGKGHERTQTVGQRVIPYSDRATVAHLFGLISEGGLHAS